MHRLVELWKEQRAMLARQLEMLDSGEMSSGTDARNVLTKQDIERLKAWIAELDVLIGEARSAGIE